MGYEYIVVAIASVHQREISRHGCAAHENAPIYIQGQGA